TRSSIAPRVRLGSYPSSTAISRSWRPLMPPASLMAPNAVSRPSFICRPSSLAGPLEGAAMPERISLSFTPPTAAAAGAGAGRTGTAAATELGVVAGAPTVGGAVPPDPSNVTGAAGGVTVTVRPDRVELDASCGAGAAARLANL